MLTQPSHMLQVAAGSRSSLHRLQGGCVQTFCTSQAEVYEVRQGVFMHSFLLAGNLLRSCSDNRLNAVLVMFRNSCFSASKIKLIRGWLIDGARPMNFSNGISRYSLCQEWGVGTALVFIFALTPSILMIRIQTDTSLASAVLKSLCLTHQMERCASDVCMHVLRLRLLNVFEFCFFFEKVYQIFKPWVYC